MRKSWERSALLIGLCILLCSIAAAASKKSRSSEMTSINDDPFYQTGIKLYAAGQRAKALGAFRVALSHHPGDRLALAAVRRVQGELVQASPFEFAPKALENSLLDRASDAFDKLMLVDISWVVNFDDSVGNDLSNVGTLQAVNGRVAQLIKEQQFSLEHARPFLKDREMRSLVRRMPTIAA
jgi:hypothetical protein